MLISCAQEPPKCADQATSETLKKIIIEQIDPDKKLSDAEVKDNITINTSLATAFDKDIKKYSCEASVVFFQRYTLPINYSSQLDDNNQHIVIIKGVREVDWLTLKGITSEYTKKSKESEPEKNEKISKSPETADKPNSAVDYSKYLGRQPAEIFDEPNIASKFKAILSKDYDEFVDGLSVATQIELKKDYYFGSGCAPHVCSIEEAAFAINKSTEQIFAVQLTGGDSFRIYGASSGNALPEPLRDWYRERGGPN